MRIERRSRKKSSLPIGRKRLLKDSLKEFLGSGLLDSRSGQTLSLFFLKGVLNSRLLNTKNQKN